MSLNPENEKQFLTWYYESLKSISKIQSKLSWIIFLLLIFSILLEKQNIDFINIPFIKLNLDVKTIKIFIPLILSIVFWEYIGSMGAVKNAVQNIKNRLKNLGYNDNEFNLYDIDTSLTLFDLITFNFKKNSETYTNKKYNLRHLPYLFYLMFFLGVKVHILFVYNLDIYANIFFILLIIIDFIFSYPLFKDRVRKFIKG